MMLRSGAPLSFGLVLVLLAATVGRGAASEDGRPDGKVVPASSLIKETKERWARNGTTDAMPAAALDVGIDRSAFGRSGHLRVRMVMPGERLSLPLTWSGPRPADAWYRWAPVMGTRPAARRLLGVLQSEAPDGVSSWPSGAEPLTGPGLAAPELPGVYQLEVGAGSTRRVVAGTRLLVLVPNEVGRNGRLNGYHIGAYPRDRRPEYSPPQGFIEVTRYNRDLPITRNFRLRDFLTKDQHDIWPKYLALDTLLLDKLELVVDELRAMGVTAERMHVMSGFRTPQYNRGIRQTRLSRHQFGDAADVWIDNEGNGWMSDLNGDGRVDRADALVMLRAVERVERRHPELIGGAGIYPPRPGVRGPFVHIDVRGDRARW